MRLLLDQGLPRGAGEVLGKRGHDVLHVADAGLSAAPDDVIVDWAAAKGRIIVTLDADFHAILALRGASGPSVLRVRAEGLRAEALADLLDRVLGQCGTELLSGAMATVDDTGAPARVRRLPL